MLMFCTPGINVLSKVDTIEDIHLLFDPQFERLVCPEVPDKLHQAIVQVLAGFDLVSYSVFPLEKKCCDETHRTY